MPRRERSTFNLDLVEHGWAAPFVIYLSVPGELDLPRLVDAAATARSTSRGIWAQDATLLGYEYRAMEKLFRITKKIVAGDDPPQARPAPGGSATASTCARGRCMAPRTTSTFRRNTGFGSGRRTSARQSAG
jgi:hypothetical protein